MDEYFCPNCGATLNYQDGFDPSLGAWTCTECGHTNGINEDEIIDGKHFTCPECGAILNNQFGFNAYDDDGECSSCGAKLTNSYSDDDYSVVEEDKICCPNCDANLEDQWGYSEYNYDWTCTECGAHLHREYTSDEFEQVEEKSMMIGNVNVVARNFIDILGIMNIRLWTKMMMTIQILARQKSHTLIPVNNLHIEMPLIARINQFY